MRERKRRGKHGARRVMVHVQKEEQVGQPSSKVLRFYGGRNTFLPPPAMELSGL